MVGRTRIKRGDLMKRQGGDWGSECLADLPNDRRYLIGVSGGRDSVALLHWLARPGLSQVDRLSFRARLARAGGKSDARFVERLAQKHSLQFELGSADIAALAKRRKQSIETVARQERLAFFEQVGRRRRCLTIFLGASGG